MIKLYVESPRTMPIEVDCYRCLPDVIGACINGIWWFIRTEQASESE